MTQHDLHTIDLLNRLYSAHRASLLPRLAEVHSFISWASADDVDLAHRMARESAEHEQWLYQAIEQAGGGLFPAHADAATGNLHYLELNAMIPIIIESVRSLVETFQQAQTEGELAPEVQNVISAIAQRLRHHLEQLEALHAGSA